MAEIDANTPVAWDERNTRAWTGVLTELTEKVEELGASEKLRTAFFSFLLENEEEIMTKSAGPSRDFLMDMKARKERGFS